MYAILFAILLGCGDDPVTPGGTEEIPVKFITFVNTNSTVPVEEMGLLLINSLAEADQFVASLRFADPNLEHLARVDYEASVVVVLAGGARGNNSYLLTVNRIVSDGEQVTIHALFFGSPVGSRVISYPVQVFAMPRTPLPIAVSVTYECDGRQVGPDEACFRFPGREKGSRK